MRRAAVLVLLAGCSFQVAASGSGPASDDASDAVVTGDADADAQADAAADAGMIDAPGCSAAGLSCPGGTTPVPITCATGCWYGCTDGPGVTEPMASGLCTAWGGKLARIDSTAEDACMRSVLDGAIWIGIEQATGASSVGSGWTWNDDGIAPPFTNWAMGQPNDFDGFESGYEQCAYDSTSGTWQDTTCTSLNSRFSCRR